MKSSRLDEEQRKREKGERRKKEEQKRKLGCGDGAEQLGETLS